MRFTDTAPAWVLPASGKRWRLPWSGASGCRTGRRFTTKYAVGDTAAVRVVKLMTFGAFAEIVPGVDGLIHISQIADHRVEKPGDVLAD